MSRKSGHRFSEENMRQHKIEEGADMVSAARRELLEANRKRYEELRAAGQSATPKSLPELTSRDGAPIATAAVVSRETIPSGWYTTLILRRGEALRIVDETGRSS